MLVLGRFVVSGTCVLDNLELRLVEGHEAEVEAGEEAGHGEEKDEEDHHQPDRQEQLVHFNLKPIENAKNEMF